MPVNVAHWAFKTMYSPLKVQRSVSHIEFIIFLVSLPFCFSLERPSLCFMSSLSDITTVSCTTLTLRLLLCVYKQLMQAVIRADRLRCCHSQTLVEKKSTSLKWLYIYIYIYTCVYIYIYISKLTSYCCRLFLSRQLSARDGVYLLSDDRRLSKRLVTDGVYGSQVSHLWADTHFKKKIG